MSQQRADNERCAAWFGGPKPERKRTHVKAIAIADYQHECWRPSIRNGYVEFDPYDFFTEEKANAMLLEAMPQCRVDHYEGSGEIPARWVVYPNRTLGPTQHFPDAFEHPDRKTAVVAAFLAWIEVNDGAKK